MDHVVLAAVERQQGELVMAELGLRERANFHSNTAKRLRRYKERTQLLNLVRVVPGFANVTLQNPSTEPTQRSV